MYGDEGVFSTDFTQTYPVFYMEQLFNKFASPGDLVVPVKSSYGLLSAFATKGRDGKERVMIVNKNPTATITTELCFAGFRPAATATQYTYGMDQDNAAKNGQPQTIGTTQLTGIGNNTTLSFPPYSVSVLVFTPILEPPLIHPVSPIKVGPGSSIAK